MSEDAGAYFDTPQRAERLRLLMHLVANAGEVPYLRAPPGGGKTTFVRRLTERLSADYTIVWISAGVEAPLRDQVAATLGLGAEDGNWVSEAVACDPVRPLLLVVDDADRLKLAEIADLLDLRQAGARLLLAGTGNLTSARGDWELQFVDLPPFTEKETRAFIQARTVLPEGSEGECMVIALHRASEGLPGLLLDALESLPGELPRATASTTPGPRRWPWVVGVGALAGVAGVLLWFQNDINRLIASGAPVEGGTPVVSGSGPVEEPAPLPGVVAPRGGEGVVEEAPPVSSTTREASEAGDPVLDAIIAEAIHAASQPPSEAVETGENVPEAVSEDEPENDAAPESAQEKAVDDDALSEVMADAAAAPAPQNTQEGVGGVEEEVVPTSPASTPPSQAASEVDPVSSGPDKPPARASEPVPELPASRPPKGGLAWLKAQPRGRYTLQLLGARDREAIRRFVRRHRIPQPWAVFERELDGRPWYSLVAGSYPDRAAAVAARARLPAAIARAGVWPRTFGSIQAQLQGQ